jgi:hypothetical protein
MYVLCIQLYVCFVCELHTFAFDLCLLPVNLLDSEHERFVQPTVQKVQRILGSILRLSIGRKILPKILAVLAWAFALAWLHLANVY